MANILATKPNNIAIEIHDLTVSYQNKPALWDIDLHLPSGQLISIIGLNGAGKSTLLKAAMSLVKADSGYVKFFGQTLAKMRGKVSYMPQRASVDWDFPISVYEVVMMGRYSKLGVFSRVKKSDQDAVMHYLDQLEMRHLAHQQIGKLSGGQQQRVFFARALAQEASIYLMDEPLAAIDAATERSITTLLTAMKKQGKTIVVVLHDLQAVQAHFDWAVLLNKRVIASGPTQDVLTTELLRETYGSQLTILDKMSHLIKKHKLPVRE